MSNPRREHEKRAFRLMTRHGEENDTIPARVFLLSGLALCLLILLPWTAIPVHADPLQSQAATEPSPRYGHTMAPIGEKVYLFGGNDTVTAAGSSRGGLRGEVLNDLWAFNIDQGEWGLYSPDVSPVPRSGHSTAVYGDKMFILFGTDSNGNALNDTQAYSVTDNAWNQVNPQSLPPPARRDSAASVVDGNVYVYGGRDGSGQLSTGSIWKLNDSTGIRQWTEGATHPDMARYGHTLTNVDGKLYVFAGSNGSSLLNDLSYYDPASDSWTKITPESDKPPARAFHSAVAGTGNITVLGGTGEAGGLNDVWEFDIIEKKWVRRSDLPIPRTGFSAVVLPSSSSSHKGASSGSILIFGGISDGQVIGDTYVYSPADPVLTLTRSGTGTGTVTSSPSGIDCGSTCSASYSPGTVVTLTAAASSGSTFAGWSGGGCSGEGTCVITVNSDTAVTAQFTLDTTCTYTVTPAGPKTFASKSGSITLTVKGTGETKKTVCPQPPVTPSDAWITATPSPWKNNRQNVKVAIAAHTSSSDRSGSVAVTDKTFQITQKGAACKITRLTPASQSVPVAGSSYTFEAAVTPQDCPWTATATRAWIGITTGTGTGTGNVSYTVPANTTKKNRSGAITVTLDQSTKKKSQNVKQKGK